jgi:2-polyprenyl-6-methoxyphenol hydroxylase-like FAD-dependent oxidoreductase
VKEGTQVSGLIATRGGEEVTIRAKVVVGADGAFSKVRQALQIPAEVHLYPQGYLIAILDSPLPITEARYYVGKKTILGLFPAAGDKVYCFYMIPTGTYDRTRRKAFRRCGQPGRLSIHAQAAVSAIEVGVRLRLCRPGVCGPRPGWRTERC